jgi:hypothetical protein
MIIVNVPGKGRVEFEDGTPTQEIEAVIDQEFPLTGSEVREMMLADPEYELTLDNYKVYEKYQNDRSFGSKIEEGLEMVPGVLDHLATVVGEGVGALFDSSIKKAPANLIEGAAQGTKGLWQMLAQSENPDAMMFELKDFVFGNGSVEDRFKQTKEAMEFRRGMERNMTGEETVLMRPEWVDNRIVQATALVADPTLLAGLVTGGTSTVAGLGAKAPRIAALAQRAKSAARKATQAGLHAAGTAARVAAAPVTKGIQAAGRAIESATGVSAKNIHAGAVLAGGASLASPVTAAVGSVVVGAEAVNLGGDVLQRLAKGIGSQPSRIKALQSLAMDASAPKSVRVFAHAAHAMGGDIALDLGLKGAAGAASGAVVGGLIGLGYDDIQGAIPASAAGVGMGAAGAGLFRSLEHGLGRVSLDGQQADGARWLASIDNPRRRDQAIAAASIMENKIPGSSALLADAAVTMEAIGGQLRFVNEKVSRRIGGQKNSQGFFEPRQIGDKPTVIINLDSFGKTTAPHEVVHALLQTVSGGEQLVAARESLFGSISPDGTINSDGIVSSDTLRAFSEKYKSLMGGDAKETWDGFIQDAFNDKIDLARRLEAQSEIADEFMAYYGGYSSFSKGLFGKMRYNNSLHADKIESVVGVVMRNSRKLFEGRTRRQLKMDFTGESIESPFANAKHPGMKGFVMDVMKGTRDTQTEGNATKVRYNMKKATKEGMQALADAGYQSAFVRDAQGKVIRQRTVGEERAQMRAQYNTIRDALIREGIEPDSRMQVNDDGTQSFNLGEIFSTLDPAQLPTLMQAMEKFLGPNHRRFITQVASQLTGGLKNEFDLTYWAATTRSKNDSAVYGSLGVSQRNVIPYTVEVSEAGGVYVRAIDMNAVAKRFNKAFQGVKGLFSTRAQAMKDFHSYMDNLTSDNPIPSKDLKISGLPLGESKRNFFHEVLGTVPSQKNRPPLDRLPRPGYVPEHGVDKVFKSFRVDRMSKLDQTGKSLSFTEEKTYQLSQANFMPWGVSEVVSAEFIAGKSTGFLERMIDAPMSVRWQYHQDMLAAHTNPETGKLHILEELGIDHEFHSAESAYRNSEGQMEYNPAMRVELGGQASRQQAELVADLIGLYNHQESVGGYKPAYKAGSKPNALSLAHGGPLTGTHVELIFKALGEAPKKLIQDWDGKMVEKGLDELVAFFPNDEGGDFVALDAAASDAIRDVLFAFGNQHLKGSTLDYFRAGDTIYRENNWKENRNGEDYTKRIKHGVKSLRGVGPNLLKRLDNRIGDHIQDVYRQYEAAGYGDIPVQGRRSEKTELQPKTVVTKNGYEVPVLVLNNRTHGGVAKGKKSADWKAKQWADYQERGVAADAAQAELPGKGVSPEEWSGLLGHRLDGVVGAELPTNPTRLHEWVQNPKLLADKIIEAYERNPDLVLKSKEGLDSVREMHEVAKRGEMPVEPIALNYFWGFLSRMLGPYDQEAGWIRLTSSPKFMEILYKSIDGKFDVEQGTYWTAEKVAADRGWYDKKSTTKAVPAEFNKVSKKRRAEAGRIAKSQNKAQPDTWVGMVYELTQGQQAMRSESAGMNSIQNVNGFYDMLAKWSGRWGDVQKIINDKNLTGPQMRENMWRDGLLEAGIHDKVNSFVLLTLAREDVVIVDRWQMINFWEPMLEQAVVGRSTKAQEALKLLKAGKRQEFESIVEADRDGIAPQAFRPEEPTNKTNKGYAAKRKAWENWNPPSTDSMIRSQETLVKEINRGGGDGLYYQKRGGIPVEKTMWSDTMQKQLSGLAASHALYRVLENALDYVGKEVEQHLPPELQGNFNSVSGIHWVTWNIAKNEPVGHSSLESVNRLVLDQGFPKTKADRQEFSKAFNAAEKFTEAPNREKGGFNRFALDEKGAPKVTHRFQPQDADYQKAVDSGDVETQQRLVDEAAKKAGYNVGPVFHGSPYPIEGNKFKKEELGSRTGGESAKQAFFFSSSEDVADSYAYGDTELGRVIPTERQGVVDSLDSIERTLTESLGELEEGDTWGDIIDVDLLNEWSEYKVDEGEIVSADDIWDEINNISWRSRSLKGRMEAAHVGRYFLSIKKIADEGEPFKGKLSGFTDWAEQYGYDGGVMRSIQDPFGSGYENIGLGDHYFVFDPTQIKSADPITRDADGNIVPLSKRFHPADDAARFAGFDVDMPLFHKTWEQFNSFKFGGNDPSSRSWKNTETGEQRTLIGQSGRGFWFSPDRNNTPAGHNTKKDGERVMQVYAKTKNPLVVDADTRDWAVEVFGDGHNDFPLLMTDEAYANVQGEGHDAIHIYHGKRTTADGQPDEVVILDPENIKSADPETFNDQGDVIPVDERFDIRTDDTRYHPSDRMGQIDGDAGPVERSVPAPVLSGARRNVPTATEALSWLTVDKRKKGRARGKAKAGQRVGLRIDIPAYQKSNFEVYTVSVHDHSKNPRSKAGPVIGYEPHAYVEGPLDFVVNEKFAEKIKDGDVSKNTIAVVEGNWRTKDIVPKDIESWTQVGMNPKRHSYFYDRETFRPVTGGDAAFSVGGTVFVQNAKFGQAKDFKFQPRDPTADDVRPAKNRADVDMAWADGHEIFAASDMDEQLNPVTTREMLNAYTVDTLFIGGRGTKLQPGNDGSLPPSSTKSKTTRVRHVNSPAAGFQSYRRRSDPNG